MSTILVVDDMAVFREPIAAALRMNGYGTLTATDGAQALSTCRAKAPDLVVLDLSMPGLDGMGFLKAWSAEPAANRPTVIVLSASSDREQVIAAARLGVREFMLKNQFSLKELLARVKKCLAEKALNVGPPAEQVASSAGAPTASTAPPASAAVSDAAATAAPAVVASAATAAAPDDGPFDPSMPPSLLAIKPIISRADLRDRLDHCEALKAMSPSVAQILALCNNANCSIEHVARALKQDQALALTILKIANSAIYTRGEPIESVHKAVTRIGLAQIRQIVTNIGVVDSFFSVSATARLSPPLFWEHSIACGLTCAIIARGLDASADDVDSAFTMGLLHDVGRMVYVEMLGEDYDKVQDVATQLQLPLEQVESRMLLINHADAMDRVLHAWRFPKNLINPIAFHHLSAGNIRRMSPRTLRASCMLALANRLTHAMLIGDSGNATIYPTSEFVGALGLSPRVMEQIEESVPSETDDIKLTMLARYPQGSWQPLFAQLTAQFKKPIKPAFIGCDHTFDPFRILCSRFERDAVDLPVNVALVHLTNIRERTTLGNRLREMESNRGLAGTPLVIASPTGNLRLEDIAMAGRQCVLLPSTVSANRLVAAFNELVAGDSQAVRHVA